jgi:hypothetical protein
MSKHSPRPSRQATIRRRCCTRAGGSSSSSRRPPGAGTPTARPTLSGRLSETTRASGTDWALGIEARSRALVTEGRVAEHLYREAIDRLGRTRIRVELARAHLLYGEWLRRQGRPLDARERLCTAHEMFAAMGVEALDQRAARELLATGETGRKRTVQAPRSAHRPGGASRGSPATGLSNPDIGARLFISPRTVEYHLRKVFTKVGISSRKQLREARADGSRAALRP